jgi:uncharacterized protein YecE (DUF72 family)
VVEDPQLPLFEPEPRAAAARPHPALSPWIRFGTSSFSSLDWVGPFYPAGMRPADFLRCYAERFEIVEVDSTYYAIPTARTVDGWAEKTPEGFRLSAKFPRSIVHGGDGPRPDGRAVLDRDAASPVRDEFLNVMTRLGPRLGPLVLQFPFFSKQAFAGPGPFLERLDAFLADLPPGLRVAVEVRNPEWIAAELAAVLRARAAALVLVDRARMPHGDEVAERLDPVTTDFAYVRLLGDRRKVEALTTTWGREVLDWSERLERWAALLERLHARQVRTSVFVNNHYAGHAPGTVRRLQALFEARVRRSDHPPSA